MGPAPGALGALILFALPGAVTPAGAEPAPGRVFSVEELHRRIGHVGDGAVVRPPPGVYRGRLEIRKPVELRAEGDVVLDAGGEGDVVRILAPGVTLRGFVLRGTGDSLDRENAAVVVRAPRAVVADNRIEDALFGIYLKEAPDSVVRGNTILGKRLPLPRRGDAIRLWESPRCRVTDNVVEKGRDVVLWFSDGLYVARNVVRDGRYGLHFMYSDDNVLEENRLERNSVGAFLMYSKRLTLRRNLFLRNRGPSGFGVGLKDMDGVQAEGNLFAGNRVGLHIDSSPGALDVRHLYRRNVFAWNDIAVAFMPSVERNDFADNLFVDNFEQVALLGQGRLRDNRFTVDGRGNYWSDYRGFDLDGDGVGDLPHEVGGAFESLVDREPLLRLFLYSPIQQAVDFAARAFPLFEAPPKAVDRAPLVRAEWPEFPVPRHGGGGAALAAFSGALAAIGSLLLALAIRGGRALGGTL